AGFFFGADCSEVSGLHILSWVAGFENSAIAWYVAVSQKLADGTAGLIKALAEDSAADITLGAPVAAIDTTDHAVTVTTRDGRPGGHLLVGFGPPPDGLDVNDGGAITDAVHEFLPDADVVSADAHDWNADEFSQGTWMAYRPGQVMRHASALQRPEGRVAVA